MRVTRGQARSSSRTAVTAARWAVGAGGLTAQGADGPGERRDEAAERDR